MESLINSNSLKGVDSAESSNSKGVIGYVEDAIQRSSSQSGGLVGLQPLLELQDRQKLLEAHEALVW